ncbi:DNA polymerase delta subunit 4 [Favolaschia claudopus]|uniref:DNA polymerase delta subunit 4 n=1 Tax=Favolaschia claudopus TaxID=2862362 RepID=A0AAW0DJ40_9AGAR
MPKTPKNNASLKQSTLSFSASKRTASGTQKVPQRGPSISRRTIDIDRDEIEVDDVELSSDDEDEIEFVDSDREEPPEKKSRTMKSKSTVTLIKAVRPREEATSTVRAPLDQLNQKDKRWSNLFSDADSKRGKVVKPIHGENQDKFHNALRLFDLSYEYGPCVGVTRLQRWERAEKMGLNPPLEIHDILTSAPGQKEISYTMSVFHDQV